MSQLETQEKTQEKETRTVKKCNLVGDTPINGQDWCVLTFVSPEDMVVKKNVFYMDNFLRDTVNEYLEGSAMHMVRAVNAQLIKAMEEKIEKYSKSKNENHKLIAQEMNEVRQKMQIDEDAFLKEVCHKHLMELDDLLAKFENYKVSKSAELDRVFDKENGFKTSVRGVKFGGAFPTSELAEEHARMLRDTVNDEKHLDRYVVKSFEWLPFDPNPNSVKDQRYENEQLDELMRRKRENEEFKEKMFEERKRELMKGKDSGSGGSSGGNGGSGESASSSARNAMKEKLKEKYAKRVGL